VEVLVDNPAHKLKPGLFSQGAVLLGRDDNVLAVPEETVSNLAGVSSVYVIDNGIVKQTTIQVGQHQDKLIEVVSGLKGDEILAASNLNELVTGTRVGVGDDEGGPAGPAGDPPGEGGQRRGGRGEGKRGGGEGKGSAQ